MRQLLLVLFMLLAPAVSTAATPQAPTTADQLPGCWQLEVVRNQDDEIQVPPELSLVFRFTEDHGWSADFFAGDEGEESEGVWSLRDDVLTLESDQGAAKLLVSLDKGRLVLGVESDPGTALVFERCGGHDDEPQADPP